MAELATAESQIEGLQELDFDMQKLRFEAEKQEQELQKCDMELQRQKQELQDAVQNSEFRAKKRDKQLAYIKRMEQQTQDRHELHMMQQKDLADACREVSRYYMEY